MNPITKPTKRLVAEMLTDCYHDYHDGRDWRVSATSARNMVDIAITPLADDFETWLPEQKYRAFVFRADDTVYDAPEPSCDLNEEISGFDAALWLWHYKQPGGYEPIAYTAQLMVLISIADANERTDLITLYPGLVAASELAQAGRFDELRTIAESASWEGW